MGPGSAPIAVCLVQTAYTCLHWAALPRGPVGLAGTTTSSIVKQPPASLFRATPGMRIRTPDARHRPVFRPAPGLAGLPVPHLPRRGVRNDRAFHRARGARIVLDAGSPHAVFAAHGQWPSPTPKIVELNRAVEADLRLRSAREWTLRLAACPRGCHWRRRTPFVRAVARTCTWAVRPSRRRLSPRHSRTSSPLLGSRSGIVAAIRIPLRVSKTIATRPLPERNG